MYKQVSKVKNPEYRDSWVSESLRIISGNAAETGLSLLDVGAGTGPYRKEINELGFHYRGHDFASYVPDAAAPGLQNPNWVYTELEFICDLLEIPPSAKSNVVLCTEVLEHVPNPVEAFHKLWNLVKPGGVMLVTVPFLSLMHQAPHWYSSGLSPFWFAHHAREADCHDFEIKVHGDYFDLMYQEMSRVLSGTTRFQRVLSLPFRYFFGACFKIARELAPTSLQQMGGFGVTFFARKPEH